MSGRERAVAGAIEHFTQFLLGKYARNIGQIWQEIYRSQYFEGGRVLSADTNGIEALYDLQNDPDEQQNVIDNFNNERSRLDAELNHSLLSGMQAANADKKVPQVKSESSNAFYRRHWIRPYRAPGD